MMYCENNAIVRWYISIRNIIDPTKPMFVSAAISIVLLVSVGAISSTTVQMVDAQMNNTNMAGTMMSGGGSAGDQNESMNSNKMTATAKPPALNITTAAPPITPAIFKSMASQIHVDLINATMIAEKWVGSDSQAVSSMVGVQNGHLVYAIWVIDSDSGLHQIVVDPENGKVLLAYQPMSMTGPFS